MNEEAREILYDLFYGRHPKRSATSIQSLPKPGPRLATMTVQKNIPLASGSKKARRKGKGRPTRKELRPDATQSKPLEETKHTDDGFHFIQDEDGLFHGLLSSKQRKPI